MCSTPKPRKQVTTKALNKAISSDMSSRAYSKMIKQANAAYEKKHAQDSGKKYTRKKPAQQQKTKSWAYWLTQASLTELRQLLISQISFH